MNYRLVLTGKIPYIATAFYFPQWMFDAIKDGDKDQAFKILEEMCKVFQAYTDLTHESENIYYKIVDKFKFLVDADETDLAIIEIINDLLIRKSYEPETTKLIKSVVKEGDVVVDVGASIGHFTLLLADQVGPSGQVHSFEPTKNQFRYLEYNIKANGFTDRVKAYNLAALDQTEKELERRDSNGIHTKIQVNAGSVANMQGVALDDILPDKVDFIKIDVDGAEPKVLKGLIKTIEKNPQLQMVIEYYPEYIKKLGNEPKDMIEILDKYFTYEKIEGDYGDKYWNYICKSKTEI